MIKNSVAFKPETSEVAQGTQVGTDSLLGESTVVAAKTSVKRTVVGNHVKIGKHCKIINCVIMDYAIIEDGVKLESSIVCRGAKVSARSELKDCEVAGQFVVPPDTHAKGEQLIKFMSEDDEDE
ncbi:hypothetical protein HDU91_004072 [Kappamyces sp. JEL0680]|nr:hypothetical protein HDU91_004072 [Kappamyces sp. JEL0680]